MSKKMTPDELLEFLRGHGLSTAFTRNASAWMCVAWDVKLSREEILGQTDNAMLKRYIMCRVDHALADIRDFYESNLEDLK